MPTKVLLADDHTMFRETLRNILFFKGGGDYVIVAEASNGEDTLTQVARYHPDILILDFGIPDLGRLSNFCQEVAHRSHTTRILILTGYSERGIAVEAALGGAKAYVVKGSSVEDLLDAVATIKAGGIWVDPKLPREVFQSFLQSSTDKLEKIRGLSRQELQILCLLAQGLSNKEIGDRLHIDKRTVRNHLTHIYSKLGVRNRLQAIRHFLGDTPSKASRCQLVCEKI